MHRRIALIAPPWYPVPPHGYGGIELVVALLTTELRRAGDEVLLFAAEGSELATHPIAPRHWAADLRGPQERVRELTYAAQVRQALQALEPVDVVHDHCGVDWVLGAALAGRVPVVHTVHGVIGDAERGCYASLPPSVGLVAISAAQRATAPALAWLGTVPNAVDVDALAESRREDKEPYLLCLARICPDKGQHLAIEAARRAGRRLVLAGKVEESPASHAYFREHIEPAIDGDAVVYLANVGGAEKSRLLARAHALLAPLQWEEPFGLALAEAMASGTPVVAFPRGAASELVTPGVTGFLVRDVEGLVQAIGDVEELDPARCAQVARERFSPSGMARGYRALYELSIAELAPATPGVRGGELSRPPSRELVLGRS